MWRLVLILLVGILIGIYLYTLTKPQIPIILNFSAKSTNKLKYIDVPNTISDTNILVLPTPEKAGKVNRYQVNIPTAKGPNQTLKVKIPFPERVNFQVYRNKVIRYEGISGMKIVTLQTKYNIDNELVWFIAKSAPLRTTGGSNGVPVPPIAQCQTPETLLPDALSNAGNAIFSIATGLYLSALLPAITAISDFFKGSQPEFNVACAVNVISNLIDDEAASLFVNTTLQATMVNISVVQSAIATYVAEKESVAKAFTDYASGGDPSLLETTNACSFVGTPTQSIRTFLYGASQNEYCVASLSIYEMISLLTGTGPFTGTGPGTITYLYNVLSTGVTTPTGIILTASQLLPLVLPFIQMISTYVALIQEAWKLESLTSGSNNPWIIPNLATYETFRNNMILWIPVLEASIFNWKTLMVNTYVTAQSTGFWGPSDGEDPINNYCFTVYNYNSPTNPAPNGDCKVNIPGAIVNQASSDYFCSGWSVDQNTDPPPCSTYLALDSSKSTFSKAFNSSLNYNNDRTCFGNVSSDTASCCYNANEGEVPLTQGGLPTPYMTANGLSVIDFPSDQSQWLPKYWDSSILSNTDLNLGTPYGLLCFNAKNTNYRMGPQNPASPQINEAPADDFIIYQQIFIDKWMGLYNQFPAPDGPGNLDAFLTNLYLVSGLVSSQNPRFGQSGFVAPIKMPYINIGDGNDYMPGCPYGVNVGYFVESNAYLNCTIGKVIAPVGPSNNTQCSSESWATYFTITSEQQNGVVDATVDVTGTVGCPAGVNNEITKLVTCQRGTQVTLSPSVSFTANTVGTQGSPAANSRVLLCSDASNNVYFPALSNCGSGSPSQPYDFPYAFVCDSFWCGNTAWSTGATPAYPTGFGYQRYSFFFPPAQTTLVPAFTPTLNSLIKIESEEQDISYLFLVACTDPNTCTVDASVPATCPSALNTNGQTVYLNFIVPSAFYGPQGYPIGVAFDAYVYGPCSQKAQLSYISPFPANGQLWYGNVNVYVP